MIFEEKGGDPTRIRFSRRNISSICGLVAADEDGNESSNSNATIHLQCPKNRSISTVKFASFGTPTGKCGSFSMGDCHDPNSTPVVEKVITASFALIIYDVILLKIHLFIADVCTL